MHLLMLLLLDVTPQAGAEKQLVLTITGEDLRGGIVSAVTWDGGILTVQGVFAGPTGELAAKYFVKPADRTTVRRARATRPCLPITLPTSSGATWRRRTTRSPSSMRSTRTASGSSTSPRAIQASSSSTGYSIPAALIRRATGSDGCAPLASQSFTFSASRSIVDGSVCGL